MSDSTRSTDDRALAAEYVLGLMAPHQAEAFALRVQREPAVAELVGEWQEEFSALAEDIAPVKPPRRVWRKVKHRVHPGDGAPSWLIPAVPGLLAAALALTLYLAPDLLPIRAPTDPRLHADLAAEDGSLVLAAGYDSVRGALYVIPYLAPEEGRDHELWLIEGDNPPVSLGLLPSRRPARLPMTEERAAQLEGAVLAISVEPDGGSPTGAPTGPVIATGPVTPL